MSILPLSLRRGVRALAIGLTFTVLAATYLAIQYMLALKRTMFLIFVGAVAVAEPILLLNASRKPTGFAAVVLAVQVAGAAVAFVLALRRDGTPPSPAGPASPDLDPLERAPAEPLAHAG